MMRLPRLAAVLLFTLTAASATAGNDIQIRVKSDYESGVQMAERGDLNMALTFFGQGAEKGDAKSLFALGTYYHSGQGVEKDLPKALALFERASAAGLPAARAMLGIIYREGQGVTKDAARAISYFKQASEGCSDIAQEKLAQMLYAGEGIAQDRIEALAYLYVAANSQENPDAVAGVRHVERELSEAQREQAKVRSFHIAQAMQCKDQ